MQDQPIAARSPVPEDDAREQAAVLSHLLLLYPAHLTFAELLRELVDDPRDFMDRDDIERAVRDLARAGLLHRHGDFVFPTRAAACFAELPMA